MSNQDPLLTDMRHAPGWYAILPQPAPANRLKGQQVADWVVVGAGVTGLAAARRLAELAPEARIILLDSYRVGYGASGRNSGFIIDTPHLTEQFGVETNRRISRLVIAGLAELEGLVRKHEIECEWSPRGHLTAVVESKRIKNLHATVRTLEAVDEEYDWLDSDALAGVIGTRHYHAAVNTPRTVLMNPAALCRGLGETMPENVEVCEESPVRRVEPGSPVRIECAEGSISAANVLLTTNAFIAKLNFLRRDVFPMIACASLSRPLTEDEQATMGGLPDWGITGFATVRRTLSNRILARYGSYYSAEFRLSEDKRRQLQAAHMRGVRKRFPLLANLDFEHTWAGVFCMTRNWASFFGRLERGVFASLGYSGVGVPRGTISGKLLAEYALGSESDLIPDVQAVSGPTRLPPDPFLGLGVRTRLRWYHWRSRAEW
jgi:glycine/D-amino acid oxidase-like deaminating enzyme